MSHWLEGAVGRWCLLACPLCCDPPGDYDPLAAIQQQPGELHGVQGGIDKAEVYQKKYPDMRGLTIIVLWF